MAPSKLKVAYIMSRFPVLTETFVLNEMLAMEKAGVQVELFPLLRQRRHVNHPEVHRFADRAHFHPFVSAPILRANWHYFLKSPRLYCRLVWDVLRHTFGSANFFIGAIGIFPKSVRFALEMEELGVSHVHAHFANHPAVAAMVVNRLTGIPFSFTAHGSDLHVERRMLRQKVEAAAFTVAISEYNRALILSECGGALSHKVHVIHCGVDPAVFAPSKAETTDGPLRIINVASLTEVKGHRYLLEACNLLRSRGIDFVCDLVGEGPLQQKLDAMVHSLGLREHVRFHGGQPRPVVATMLRNADVSILASVPTRAGKREGIPVVLMEAMAAGIPVVASRISGIPELVEHGITGWLAAPGDPVGIADALEQLSRRPSQRVRMGVAARQKILAEFSLEKNTSLLMDRILRHIPSTAHAA